MAQASPLQCRMTSIQKQKSDYSLVFCEGEQHERAQCCDSSCSNHTGIHKDWEIVERRAAAAGTDAHADSIKVCSDREVKRTSWTMMGKFEVGTKFGKFPFDCN